MTTFARFLAGPFDRAASVLRPSRLSVISTERSEWRNLQNRNIKTITYTNMNKNVFNYEAPEVKVVELYAEGVLCASGQLEGWEDGDGFTWDE